MHDHSGTVGSAFIIMLAIIIKTSVFFAANKQVTSRASDPASSDYVKEPSSDVKFVDSTTAHEVSSETEFSFFLMISKHEFVAFSNVCKFICFVTALLRFFGEFDFRHAKCFVRAEHHLYCFAFMETLACVTLTVHECECFVFQVLW